MLFSEQTKSTDVNTNPIATNGYGLLYTKKTLKDFLLDSNFKALIRPSLEPPQKPIKLKSKNISLFSSREYRT